LFVAGEAGLRRAGRNANWLALSSLFAARIMESQELACELERRARATGAAAVGGDEALGAADLVSELCLREPGIEEVVDNFLEVHASNYHLSDRDRQHFSITQAITKGSN
jgi:hypothetical protein